MATPGGAPWRRRGALSPADLALLRCPQCKQALYHRGPRTAGALVEGRLGCVACGARYTLADGWLDLARVSPARGSKRVLRWLYDGVPSLYEPAEAILLPLLQHKTAEATRQGWLDQLQLGALRAPEGRPLRLLEVGVGTGSNVVRLHRRVPQGLPLQVWGVDLSLGMLAQARRRLQLSSPVPYRLLRADAHALPFADASFDRVFHVGAVGTFDDVGLALSELARVALPDTPVVVVDEELAPDMAHSLFHRAAFGALTFYERAPQAPLLQLPAGAYDVERRSLSRFYYGLAFKVPAPR